MKRLKVAILFFFGFEGLQIGAVPISGYRGRNFFAKIALENGMAFVPVNGSVEGYDQYLDEAMIAYDSGCSIVLGGFSCGCEDAVEFSQYLCEMRIPVKGIIMVSPTYTRENNAELKIPCNVGDVYEYTMEMAEEFTEGDGLCSGDFENGNACFMRGVVPGVSHWDWSDNGGLEDSVNEDIQNIIGN